MNAGSIFKDTQVVVLGGVAAVAAARLTRYLSDRITAAANIHTTSSLGNAGMNLVIRGTMSSIIWAGASVAMPETAKNVYFSFMYFLADKPLVQATEATVARLINVLDKLFLGKGANSVARKTVTSMRTQ